MTRLRVRKRVRVGTIAVLVGLLGALGARAAGAQERPARAASSAPAIDAATRGALIREVAEQLAAGYVYPDIGTKYAEQLHRRLQAGDYDDITDPDQLASLLTQHLLETAADGHLRIRAPSAEERRRGLPTDRESRMGRRLESERRRNHFFTAVKVLPGNIGYLDYDQFGFLNESRETAGAAMTFLSQVDAFILDLRSNPGGLEGMNQHLASYFFGSEPVHLYNRYSRPTDYTTEYWTWPDEPVVRLDDVPLFVLIDGSTGSAAENLSFGLQGLGRATLVGESTAGGAHSSRTRELPGGFTLILPASRVFSPRTGEDWERVGVQPDVATDPEAALATAHGLALDVLLRQTEDEALAAELRVARRVYAALNTPAAPSDAASLAEYEGSFGPRRTWVENGTLMLMRTDLEGSPALELVRTGEDEFAIRRVPEVVLRFERASDGSVSTMRLRQPDGTWQVNLREQS